MLKPEEKAIYMFNRALKECIHISVPMKKEEAKNIVYGNLLAIKEALYDCTLIDNLNAPALKRSLSFYQQVKETIDKI